MTDARHWSVRAGSFSTDKFDINTANFANDTSGGLFALELREQGQRQTLDFSTFVGGVIFV